MANFSLFEVSWEVCNKVGGIHTVLSTKAKTMTARLRDDDYVAIGPWLLADTDRESALDEEAGHEEFIAACAELGLGVKVGRWRIPGRPRTILVEFSKLYEQKDDLFADLWEHYRVDSLHAGWDYAEPVLFGHAAGKVIEVYREHYLEARHRRAVVQAHEWVTGAALLYVKRALPSVGTVFTTHATVLGRALASLGHSPEDGLGDRTPAELADEHDITAEHSLEGICAHEADVFTTVSEIIAREAELLHGRAPEPLLPNGIDLDVIDELAGAEDTAAVRAKLLQVASAFVGEDVSDACSLAISGRYEFHNKGIDLVLDAAAKLDAAPGRRVVLFVLAPAGNSGLAGEVRERLEPGAEWDQRGPAGIATHNLFDAESDPVQEHCARIGLANALGSRVKVIQVPIYLAHNDGFLNTAYEGVMRAMDLTCFPSYYEPWGYTPQESLALGVPTITSDYAGFGHWARTQELGPDDGVIVLPRFHQEYGAVVDALARTLEECIASDWNAARMHDACRRTAARTTWAKHMAGNYFAAYDAALANVQERLEHGVPQARRPKRSHAVRPRPESSRPHLQDFDVSATLPAELAGLKRLARNFWWSWDPEGQSLFEELAPHSWHAALHSPVAFLQRTFPEDLAARASDSSYLAKLARVEQRFNTYLAATPAEDPEGGYTAERPIAYFSAEFGLHESLPIYSGGLGILAGDHLKSASDLGLPLVGVGLFYRMGYMHQRLSLDGAQIAVDLENEPHKLALECVRDASGQPLEIRLPLPGRDLFLRAWRVAVGRIELYLLDANTPSNSPQDRDVTRNLYGGDSEMRLQQEIVLGRGGVRLLRTLDITPGVWHINEGHAAFMTLERTSFLAHREGLTFEEAREIVRATTVFTTHTPVPAGHDRFAEDLVRRYFSDAPEWVGVPWERFWSLGTAPDDAQTFNMTYLALHFASWVNGVSRLHGEVSRGLLHPFWPALLESEVPIHSVTNGVHLPSWTRPAIRMLLVDEEAADTPAALAAAADRVPADQLWSARRDAKRALLDLVRGRLERGFVERTDSPAALARILDGLDEDALLIGFARRFAPYKRAHLLFSDRERLRALLDAQDRPVRVLVAGKAHPLDGRGQEIMKEIVGLARSPQLVGRVLFIENYDMELGRALTQGVDVWLNTPTRPLEASGTSGMKAAANGALNLSIGDGWWPEGYDGTNGWVIGDGRVYQDQSLQDELDASTLYRLLEDEVVPMFFERDASGLPNAWLERVRASLRTLPPRFNTNRMVSEYASRAYAPLARRGVELSRDRRAGARQLAGERQRVRRAFADVVFQTVELADLTDVRVGDAIEATATVDLAGLAPDDVVVELVLGSPRGERDLDPAVAIELEPERATPGAPVCFRGRHVVERSGGHAYGVRIRPRSALTPGDSLGDLMRWA